MAASRAYLFSEQANLNPQAAGASRAQPQQQVPGDAYHAAGRPGAERDGPAILRPWHLLADRQRGTGNERQQPAQRQPSRADRRGAGDVLRLRAKLSALWQTHEQDAAERMTPDRISLLASQRERATSHLSRTAVQKVDHHHDDQPLPTGRGGREPFRPKLMLLKLNRTFNGTGQVQPTQPQPCASSRPIGPEPCPGPLTGVWLVESPSTNCARP